MDVSSGIHTLCGNGDAEEVGEGNIPQVKITYVNYSVAIRGEEKELSLCHDGSFVNSRI